MTKLCPDDKTSLCVCITQTQLNIRQQDTCPTVIMAALHLAFMLALCVVACNARVLQVSNLNAVCLDREQNDGGRAGGAAADLKFKLS